MCKFKFSPINATKQVLEMQAMSCSKPEEIPTGAIRNGKYEVVAGKNNRKVFFHADGYWFLNRTITSSSRYEWNLLPNLPEKEWKIIGECIKLGNGIVTGKWLEYYYEYLSYKRSFINRLMSLKLRRGTYK